MHDSPSPAWYRFTALAFADSKEPCRNRGERTTGGIMMDIMMKIIIIKFSTQPPPGAKPQMDEQQQKKEIVEKKERTSNKKENMNASRAITSNHVWSCRFTLAACDCMSGGVSSKTRSLWAKYWLQLPAVQLSSFIFFSLVPYRRLRGITIVCVCVWSRNYWSGSFPVLIRDWGSPYLLPHGQSDSAPDTATFLLPLSLTLSVRKGRISPWPHTQTFTGAFNTCLPPAFALLPSTFYGWELNYTVLDLLGPMIMSAQAEQRIGRLSRIAHGNAPISRAAGCAFNSCVDMDNG